MNRNNWKTFIVMAYVITGFGMQQDIIRADVLPEMLHIPAGSFVMGCDNMPNPRSPEYDPDSIISYTEHPVYLDSFYMSKYPITVQQYLTFIEATGYETFASQRSPVEDFWAQFDDVLDHPVITVSRREALAYCRWLSELTGERYRLPTEAEWEYAASGGDRRLFPWGNDYQQFDSSVKQKNNMDYFDFSFPVTSIPEDESPFGVRGMYGNVREFVLDMWDPKFYERSPEQNPLNIGLHSSGAFVVRGVEGYFFDHDAGGIRRRRYLGDTIVSGTTGFRVVREKEPTILNADTNFPILYHYAEATAATDHIILFEKSHDDSSSNQIVVGEDEIIRVRYVLANDNEHISEHDEWYFVWIGWERGWVRGSDIEIVQ